MTSHPIPLAARLLAQSQSFVRSAHGAAAVEMALVLPLLLALVLGMLVYGQHFLLAHQVQQAANDGGRAAIAGLDGDDRKALAIRAVDRNLAAVPGYEPSTRTIDVDETAEAITVEVEFQVPPGQLIRSSFVPGPSDRISARATFELAHD